MVNYIESSALSRPTHLFPPAPGCGINLSDAIQAPDRILSELNHAIAGSLESRIGLLGTAVSALVCTALKIVGLVVTIAIWALTSPVWIPMAIRQFVTNLSDSLQHLEPHSEGASRPRTPVAEDCDPNDAKNINKSTADDLQEYQERQVIYKRLEPLNLAGLERLHLNTVDFLPHLALYWTKK